MIEHDAPMSKSMKTALSNLYQLRDQKLPGEIQALVEDTIGRLHEASGENSAGEDQTRLAALYQVGRLLGTSLDLDEVLNHVMDAAITLTEAERGFLILAKPGEEALDIRISRNIRSNLLKEPERKVSRTVIRTALESGKGVVTTNAQEDPRFSKQESVVSFSLRSILCVPLKARGEILGVIYVDNRAQSGLFTEEDLDILNTFASQAASAIANAQQFSQTDEVLAERVQELEELVRFSRVIHTRTSLQAILEDTQKWALSGTKAGQAWIAVIDEEEGKAVGLNVLAGSEKGKTLPKTDPRIASALEGSTPHVFEPTTSTPALLVVPLLDETRTLGVVAESKTAFSTEDLNYMTRLANLAMGAISKMDLYTQIQESKIEQAQFVSTVAHELRIPMTSIMGYTDLLKGGAMGEVNENQLNFLNVIRENVGRMSKLVSDLSDIYKAEGGRLHLDIEPMSLLQAAKNAAEMAAPLLEERGQKLEVLISEELPAVRADLKRAAQMVQYLLENASLYSPEGATLAVRARVEDGAARLMVVDSGIGVAPEDQAMIFTQFFRSEVEEVRTHKGWGLSLCVVKKLAEFMDGSIGYETEPKKGSTFWFTVPLV
jgi:signal transduction histidine kinase